MRRISRECRDRFAHRELTKIFVTGREQLPGDDASFRGGSQKGKASRRSTGGAEQVVDEAGDERGLARMAESGDGEAHRAIANERRRGRQLVEAEQAQSGRKAYPGGFIATSSMTLGRISRMTPRKVDSSAAVAAAITRREPRRNTRAVARPSRPGRIVANASAGSIRFKIRFSAASPSAVSMS